MGVIDPLRGAVPVSWLARAGQRWNDLIVVLTAEQLSLTRVEGNPWNKHKLASVRALDIISHLPPWESTKKVTGEGVGRGPTPVRESPPLSPPPHSARNAASTRALPSQHSGASQAPLAR